MEKKNCSIHQTHFLPIIFHATKSNHALLVDDTIFHMLQFQDSEFILRVGMRVSKQWLSISLQIALKFDFSERIPLRVCLLASPSVSSDRMVSVRSRMNSLQKLAQFVSCRLVSNLTELNLTHHYLGDEGARLISSSESMKNLKSLNLSHNNLSSVGATHIASSSHMSCLQVLILQSNSLREEGCCSIAKSEHMKSLTWLDLWENQDIGDTALKAIANSVYMSNLTYLRIIDTQDLKDEASIVTSCYMKNLTHLELVCSDKGEGVALLSSPSFMCTNLKVLETCIDERGAKALTTNERSKKLTTLRLSIYDDLLEACVKPIISSQYLQNLQILSIKNSSENLGDDDKWLTLNPYMKNLTSLELTRIDMDDEDTSYIGKCEALKNLQELILIENDIAKGVQNMVNSPNLSQLRVLNLQANPIGDEGAKAIGDNKYMQNLTKLNIGETGITYEGAHSIASSKYLKNLTSLIMSDNIEDQGAKSIAESEFMANLTSLSLITCFLTDEGATVLASSPFMTNLTSLTLTDNNIGYIGAYALARSIYMTNLKELDLENDELIVDTPIQELLFAGVPCLAIQKGNEQLSLQQKQLLNIYLDYIIQLLAQNPHSTLAENMNFYLQDMIEVFGMLGVGSRVDQIIETLFKVVKENVVPTSQEIFRCISVYLDSIDSMSTLLGKRFAPYFDLIWQDILKYLESPNDHPIDEIVSGLRVICSVIEEFQELSTCYISQFIPILMQYVSHTNHSAQQNALYGLGILAFYNPHSTEVKTHVANILDILVTIMEDVETQNPIVVDNACAAFSRFVVREIVDYQTIVDTIPIFLDSLPLQSDYEEFEICFQALSKLLLDHVTSSEDWNLARQIFDKLVEGLTLTEVSDDIKKMITKNIQSFKTNHPEPFRQMVFDFNKKSHKMYLREEMKTLNRFMNVYQ